MEPTGKPKVFISYSKKDVEFVDKLVKELSSTSSIDIFYDRHSIRAGETIPKRIGDSLLSCAFFICVLSPDAVQSHWVTTEWSSALMHCLAPDSKTILIPILYRECELPAPLNGFKYIDFTRSEIYSASLTELRDRIGIGIDRVGDDDRVLDEALFNMSARKRRDLFESLLHDREKQGEETCISLDSRTGDILELYRKSNYDFQPARPTFPNARAVAHQFAKELATTRWHDTLHNNASPFVVSICGFPGLGKTTFARELRLTLIKNYEVSCTIVEFERWMRDRSDRWQGSRNLISGFQPEAFHYEELVAATHRLSAGSPVEQPLRHEGDRISETSRLMPADVLLLDGVLSFADDFHRLADWSVYFDADLATRYLLSGIKDFFVRRYDAQRRESKFLVHEQTYPRLIQSLRNRADSIFIATPYHNYRYYSIFDRGTERHRR
jgi:uridine kinase